MELTEAFARSAALKTTPSSPSPSITRQDGSRSLPPERPDPQCVVEPFTWLVVWSQRLRIPAAEMVAVAFQIAKLVRDSPEDDVNADCVCRLALEEIRIVKIEVPLGMEDTPDGLENR